MKTTMCLMMTSRRADCMTTIKCKDTQTFKNVDHNLQNIFYSSVLHVQSS
jgi:hypothetical protein